MKPDVTILLVRVASGDPREAIEAAKRLIGLKASVDQIALIEIASRATYRKWARIAAVYVLGFRGDGRAAATLRKILASRAGHVQIRNYAAEALGNLGDARALSILGGILKRDEPPELKRWCVYALSEIGGHRARSLLERFEGTKPSGKLRQELREALASLR